MNNTSKRKANKFDEDFVAWMLVTQVAVVAACAYLVSTVFFTTLSV
ncbi:MAG: hypothetical protein N5837_05190 [Lactobacillus crispatus]|nr:hypothetical protein [Lactobacillus crispatus]MCT7699394.1 hypothetical protein [Lactobacillus crispatus]